MNLKKISALAAGVALAFGAAGSAQAVDLIAGDLKFTFNAYDSATARYTGNCTDAAACDAVTAPGAGAISAYNEDSWGIFSIASITRVSDNAIQYVAGQGGKFLTGIFGGLRDYDVQRTPLPGAGGVIDQVLAAGGWLKMFENNTDYSAIQGTGGRIGQFGYNGISGGTLMLDAVFATGILGGNNSATYSGFFNENGITGASGGYLNVVGGAWQTKLDTDGLTDENGNSRDLLLTSTFQGFKADNQVADWTVLASGHVTGNAIPEPGSMALFGLGLAGLAALRRRKQK